MKIIFVIFCFTGLVMGQCSDAGICSVGNHLQDQEDANIGLVYTIGSSGKPDSVTFHSFLLNGEYYLSGSTSIYASIPLSIQTGPLGDVAGLGDMIFLVKQQIYETNGFRIQLQAGTKLATGSDNKDNLPQVYQSGLGSNDILAGLTFNISDFNLGAAYQLAGERNSNITQLKRGDDLLFRGGYTFLLEAISLQLEVLSINRLQKSSIISEDGSFVEVEQSDNSQINATGKLTYKMNNKLDLSFFGALPLKERPDNSDGLKRIFSFSAGVNLSL